MSTKFNHLPVNWVDGMKVSRKHFLETQNFLSEQLMDANTLWLNQFNFGILPGDTSLQMDVQCDFSQQISVEVSHCNAVTSSGARIIVQPANKLKATAHFKDIAARYSLQTAQPQMLFILLSINPFNRVPHGEPLPEENPPRHPHTLPELHLDIMPYNQINTRQMGNILLIGKIEYKNGELIYQRDFIPPCVSVESLPVIKDWHTRLLQQMDMMAGYSTRIIEKITAKGDRETNLLAKGINQLAEIIVFHVADNNIYFRWIIPQSAPVYMCEVMLRLFQHIHTTVQCFSPRMREEVINYFNHWTGIQQGEIVGRLSNVLQANYDHNDMQSVLSAISDTCRTYLQILEQMAQREYIGIQKGDGGFVVDQRVENPQVFKPEPVKPSKFSPTDIK